jgi:hypothetical protein
MRRIPAVRLVAAREIAQRIGSRALRITTALMTVLVVAGVVIPGLVHGPATPTSIALVGPAAQSLAGELRATAERSHVPIKLSDLDSLAGARARVKDGSLDVAVALDARGLEIEVPQSASPTIEGLLTTVVDVSHVRGVLGGAGVPGATIRAALTAVPVRTVPVTSPRSSPACCCM